MARQRPLPIDPLAEAKRQWVAHGWTDAATGMSVVTSVIRAQQILMARIDAALKPFGLSFARYEMLRLLAFTRDGRMPMASAIARLQVHPTSVTNTVDRLVRAE
ncbi:MAG TPA: MarR family transcriptional regulator, partial [Microbacterium sp.]|nr:MarR family transcriptional regulator [Microbacterium sp.]